MQKVEVRTMVERAELENSPKISSEVREYIWQYIFDNLLVQKKVMTDEKYSYSVTLDLNKFNPEIHKFFTDSPFNTDANKFRPESKLNQQGNLKFANIRVASKEMDKDISPADYANIVYDAFGSFLILISKKIEKSELDELKKGLDYEYINSFNHPATIEECKFFLF
ncbi:hypothetical protein HQN84_20665 [Pedobacter steynii]|nr:hypothetical protein [Pedobacter steynii]NQX41275.1 hypothetical protein [Pedobacter steynii]